jgi:hypothetical protein
MENKTLIKDCVEFKKELHEKLYTKSGAKDFNEYIKYVNLTYSGNKTLSDEFIKEKILEKEMEN